MDPLLTPPDAVAPAGGDDAAAAVVPPPEQDQQLAGLPEDLLADVLGHVPPRWLAASRCVCKAWRNAIDARGLLCADLLPFSLAGIFVHFEDHKFPELFSRPSSRTGARAATGDLSFLCPTDPPQSGFGGIYSEEWTQYMIEDHCNGLLLLRNCVFNPATRRWNPLPPHPLKQVKGGRSLYSEHLVFDPMVSPHYEVFMFAYSDGNNSLVHASEWPPSPFKIHVFSSRSGFWEERSFIREGNPTMMREGWAGGTVVYWRGALYVHCKYNFVMRISLSDNKYRLIKPPMDIRGKENDHVYLDLGRSEKGVYFASFHNCWLQVWVLNESCGRTEWILKHDKDLKPVLAQRRLDQLVPGHWILEDINFKLFLSSRFPEDNTKQIVEEKLEWISDNENALDNGDIFNECCWDENHYDDACEFQMLGFHPHKEIVFLTKLTQTGLAYHLNSSKVECLGNMYPMRYGYFKYLSNERDGIKCSFSYTPCWVEEFPRNNQFMSPSQT